MNNFIQILKLIVMLMPMIVEMVKAIEVAMPEGGKGAAKLETMRLMLQSVYGATTEALPAFDQVWTAAQGITSAVVSLFNATGVFKRGD